jgi:hypothetical protein
MPPVEVSVGRIWLRNGKHGMISWLAAAQVSISSQPEPRAPWLDPENPRRVGIKAGYFATLRRPPLVNSKKKNRARRTSFSTSVISARGPQSPTPYSWSSLRAPPWADEESPARSPAAQIGSIYPTRARIKKPISGKPEIGAHFVSFNFLNTTIRLPRQ